MRDLLSTLSAGGARSRSACYANACEAFFGPTLGAAAQLRHKCQKTPMRVAREGRWCKVLEVQVAGRRCGLLASHVAQTSHDPQKVMARTLRFNISRRTARGSAKRCPSAAMRAPARTSPQYVLARERMPRRRARCFGWLATQPAKPSAAERCAIVLTRGMSPRTKGNLFWLSSVGAVQAARLRVQRPAQSVEPGAGLRVFAEHRRHARSTLPACETC